MPNQAAILTVGDKYATGQMKDESGDALAGIINKMGWGMPARTVVSADEEQVAVQVAQLADSGQVDIIFTIDGVGILPADRTAEAMYRVCEKWISGLPELVRYKLSEKSPAMALYRGLVGIRGKTLIINLPGTPISVRDTMDVLKPFIRQILEQLKSGVV
jgi:molybdenum cofactor synthesis domain-containing protein